MHAAWFRPTNLRPRPVPSACPPALGALGSCRSVWPSRLSSSLYLSLAALLSYTGSMVSGEQAFPRPVWAGLLAPSRSACVVLSKLL